MYIYLKERQYYKNLYDRNTVDDARRSQPHYDKFLSELMSKLPEGETLDLPRNAVIANAFYMQTVGLELLDRYENRDQRIAEWIARDGAKDERISNARLVEEPYCQHCDRQGLRIVDKSLMHRKANSKYDDPEEILFTLHCPHCDRNSAFWEDGTLWKVKPTICPKCNTEMTHKTIASKQFITFTYVCPSCQHSYKEKMDLREKKEEADPDYDKDRAHYCLCDKEFRDHLFGIRRGFTEIAELGKKWKEKRDNKYIYDAMKELKKPKIAELAPLLQPVLKKSGYIEFSLDKPEIGKDVFVGFNCLDTKSDRSDYDSQRTLKKIINDTLEITNWRLMSDGIHYRLGYLSGRLRAYECEEDLKQLVQKSKKIMTARKEANQPDNDDNEKIMRGPNGEKIIY